MSWSRLGFFVPIVMIIAFVAALVGLGWLLPDIEHRAAWALGASGFLAAVPIYLLAHGLYDEAGTFLYVPTRYWAFVAPLLGLGLAGLTMIDETAPARPTAPTVTIAPAS